MHNLTNLQITIERQDGTRVQLQPAQVVPTLVHHPTKMIGILGTMEIWSEPYNTVDFHGIDVSCNKQPFVVSREIFDALPAHRTEFITPDLSSLITTSGFKTWIVIRRFIAKAAAALPVPIPTEVGVG